MSERRSRSPFREILNEPSANEDDFPKRRRDHSPRRSSSSSAKNRVFVSSIPLVCPWMEIKDLFTEKVGDVAFVELLEDDSGKFKGCGVVEFKDAETASKAVEVMHKYEVRGRPLNVKLDSGEFVDRKRSSGRASDREFNRSDDSFSSNDFREPRFNTYGLNPDFLKSLGINGPLNNKVFISNLDYKVTEKKLEEIFKIAGKLVKVELDGDYKGNATAEFENPLEAVQAISLFNGQRLYTCIMNVQMEKFADDSDRPSKLPIGLHGIGKGLGLNGQPMQINDALLKRQATPMNKRLPISDVWTESHAKFLKAQGEVEALDTNTSACLDRREQNAYNQYAKEHYNSHPNKCCSVTLNNKEIDSLIKSITEAGCTCTEIANLKKSVNLKLKDGHNLLCAIGDKVTSCCGKNILEVYRRGMYEPKF